MNTPIAFLTRTTALRAVVLAAAFLLGIAASTAQAAPKADDAKPAAPISVTFEKSSGDDGPYLMHVTNDGSDQLKVTVKVFVSVPVHNKPSVRSFPQTKLAAGAGLTVNEVAASDTVSIYVKGHEALELVAPTGTN